MGEIAKVRYTHDAMIDEIIAFPSISGGELAQRFGYTQAWISIITNSDAFKERLAERKGEIIDPKLRASVEERLESLAKRSLDKLLERLDTQQPFTNSDLISAAKLGVGDRNQLKAPPKTENRLYVVQLPPQANSRESWLANTSRNAVDASFVNPEP